MSDLGKRLKKAADESPKPTWKLRPEVLIGPNTPKPMHGVVPREILGRSWWNKERKAAFESTEHHCIACGVHKSAAPGREWLEGHELYRIDYLSGTMVYTGTVPLCHFCHNYIHDGRLESLLRQGKIHHAKFVAIHQHGDRILEEHGLTVPPEYTGPFADWEDWRLILEGKQYPPKYKSIKEWATAYGFND